jgi:uncharacterized short protein YbdD (DUF466 family)
MMRVASVGSRQPAADIRQSTAFIARVRRVLRVVRTVIGAPDYDRYIAHMRDHHPGCEVASRDEFMTQRLESRYSRPGSRCC